MEWRAEGEHWGHLEGRWDKTEMLARAELTSGHCRKESVARTGGRAHRKSFGAGVCGPLHEATRVFDKQVSHWACGAGSLWETSKDEIGAHLAAAWV